MARIVVWIDEEHALARAGFRGVLHNLEGVEVEVMIGPWTTIGGRPEAKSGRRRRLTDHERSLLGLIAAGYTAEQIADRLGLSLEVAVTARIHLMEQLGLDRIAAEVRYARGVGLVSVG